MTVEAHEIQITKLKEEPGATSLKVEVPVERVRATAHAAATRYAKRAKLPGFRKGKAPLSVVRKQYRSAIREDVIRELVTASWKAAVDQEDLKPIADPRVRALSFEDDQPVTFELTVEVKPEITLSRVGGFRLKRQVAPVTDPMVDQQIEELRRQKAPWLPIEDARPQAGELVSVEIVTLEGDDPGDAKPYQLVLGTGQAIPDLEERIMALLPGETREGEVRYPDDFPDQARRGETRRVRVTLHEVKRRALPDLTDEFARELGDFESVADLRRALRDDLEASATRDADAEVRRQVIDELVAANGIEAPRPLVQRLLSVYAQSYGVPDDRLERFATEFGPIAERQVRRDLIIDHLAEREQLTATRDDLDARLTELAARRKADRVQLEASLRKANQLRDLERSLTEEKVFHYLLEQSSIENVQQ